MKKIALIGDSISHSLSPKLFEAAYNHELVNKSNNGEDQLAGFSYTLLDYPTLKDAFNLFLNEGYYGANITSPYKKEILSYCTELDRTAKETGAANLIIRQDHSIKAYNTDCDGVYGPLKARNIKPCNVLIVGAGGAARAAIFSLKEAGFIVTVVNRTSEKAEKLAKEFHTKWGVIENLTELLKTNQLLVYAIEAAIPALENAFLNNLMILEANYKSPFLNNKLCKEYIPGIEWLVYQAVPSFRLFTQREPNVFAMFKLANSD